MPFRMPRAKGSDIQIINKNGKSMCPGCARKEQLIHGEA